MILFCRSLAALVGLVFAHPCPPAWSPTFLGAQQGGKVLPATSLSASQRASHLLNRLSFGPRPGEAAKLAQGGDKALEGWLQGQMDPANIPDALVESRIQGFKAMAMTIPELQDAFPKLRQEAKDAGLKKDAPDYRQKLRELVPREKRPQVMEEELVSAKLIRATSSERQLQEVLADFWFNHFNVDIGKGEDRWFLMAYERDAIRPNLFGKFKDLVLATAQHPAMLWYLDNWLSVREGFDPRSARRLQGQEPAGPPSQTPGRMGGINENYARELMELHTLGVDGGYTQADIREVARCFTGWTLEKPRERARPMFRSLAHDPASKMVLGHKITAGGLRDGQQVIELLCREPATARFIATKLCRRFVSDTPPSALVDRVAKRFLETDGDLRQVYWALFLAPEFWSKPALAVKVKTPLEYTVSCIRALGGSLEDPLPLARNLARMGQPLYHCQPPTGYKDVQEAWVNTGALVNRIKFGVSLGAGRFPGVAWPRKELEQSLREFQDPRTALPGLAANLLQEELGVASREALLLELQRDEYPMGDGEQPPVHWDRLIGLLLGSPEFQRK